MPIESVHVNPVEQRPRRRLLVVLRRGVLVLLVLLLLVILWVAISVTELRTGQRLWPWSPYAFCGQSTPTQLPSTVHIGLYEEFPNPWRLANLQQVDFPVTLAIAASSREEFLRLRGEIQQTYPQVRTIYFWPLLAKEEGYYPGPWANAAAVQRLTTEAADLPTLWDLEPPLGSGTWSWTNWWTNRTFTARWLAQRATPVHLWRPLTTLGLNPLFLRLLGLHYDPRDYPAVTLQVDLYAAGAGKPSGELARILRCGVEYYGDSFVPAFGVLNDGEGPAPLFVPPETFRRYLELARQAGVSEIWIFGVNGLNAEYLTILHETLPLEEMQKP